MTPSEKGGKKDRAASPDSIYFHFILFLGGILAVADSIHFGLQPYCTQNSQNSMEFWPF